MQDALCCHWVLSGQSQENRLSRERLSSPVSACHAREIDSLGGVLGCQARPCGPHMAHVSFELSAAWVHMALESNQQRTAVFACGACIMSGGGHDERESNSMRAYEAGQEARTPMSPRFEFECFGDPCRVSCPFLHFLCLWALPARGDTTSPLARAAWLLAPCRQLNYSGVADMYAS